MRHCRSGWRPEADPVAIAGIPAWRLRRAARTISRGGLLAYPTEAVWGLGCDPHNELALRRLIDLKQRPANKGLILVAAHWRQLRPFVALDEPPAQATASWPGPVSWIVPARREVSSLITGQHATVAVRISAHPLVRALCESVGGAVVSTSANLHGRPAPRSALAVRRQIGHGLDDLLPGPLGGADRPSTIRDATSGAILRR